MSTSTVAEAPAQDVQPIDLTVVDRCDACGAQAYVRVIMTSGSSLDFCGHHFNKSAEKILATADTVIDQRYKLHETAKLDVSA